MHEIIFNGSAAWIDGTECKNPRYGSSFALYLSLNI
jgi:hypothetical protein